MVFAVFSASLNSTLKAFCQHSRAGICSQVAKSSRRGLHVLQLWPTVSPPANQSGSGRVFVAASDSTSVLSSQLSNHRCSSSCTIDGPTQADWGLRRRFLVSSAMSKTFHLQLAARGIIFCERLWKGKCCHMHEIGSIPCLHLSNSKYAMIDCKLLAVFRISQWGAPQNPGLLTMLRGEKLRVPPGLVASSSRQNST